MFNDHTSNQKGMTLIEMVVTIGLLSILSAIVVSAFPVKRNSQHLLSAQQQVQSVLRQAQQMALDQKREEDCTVVVADNSACSRVGVAFRDDDVQFFSDINMNNRYDERADYQWPNMTTSLSETVTVQMNSDVVFQADPDTIDIVNMWFNGQSVNANSDVNTMVLRTTDGTERILEIHPYAIVEAQN